VIGPVKTLLNLIILKLMALVMLLVLLLLLKLNQERISSVIILVRKMKPFISTELALILAISLINTEDSMTVISAIIPVLEHKPYILMAVA